MWSSTNKNLWEPRNYRYRWSHLVRKRHSVPGPTKQFLQSVDVMASKAPPTVAYIDIPGHDADSV